MCTHTERPSVIPKHWNAHICRECWDEKVQPLIDDYPCEPKKGHTYKQIWNGEHVEQVRI